MVSIEHCLIRPMVAADLERVLAWRNYPEVRRYMLTQHEIQIEEHCSWFERASLEESRRLLIVEEGEISLGFVQFSNVMPGASADWGFYAAYEAPKGSGRKLGICALRFAFETLQLHKVCGQALRFNDASIRFHLSLGFQQEGVLREQQQINNVYHDLICFGLLSHEWPKYAPK
jgi:UDP-4-amino-4,6-dideoxy-N-acetyl-beta-L-altrosamine N-acetyltransferase